MAFDNTQDCPMFKMDEMDLQDSAPLVSQAMELRQRAFRNHQGSADSYLVPLSIDGGDTTQTNGVSETACATVRGKTPAGGDILPASGDKIPVSGDILPASGDKVPASGDKVPSSGDKVPASGDKVPASGDKVPASGDKVPASGDKVPASGDKVPASGDSNPSGDKTPPKGDTIPPERPEDKAKRYRESYKKEVEHLLDLKSTSDKVHPGEGYSQVLKRMYPELKPTELNNLALEVKSVNGNRHVLHRGEQFETLSTTQKKVLIDNVMNDYDRAHGAKDLKDSAMDPVCEKIAAKLKARVEKSAEPELIKSLEKPIELPKPVEQKPEPPKVEAPKVELPMEVQIKNAEEACEKSFEAVEKHSDLAIYVSKHFDTQSDVYKSTMKGLAEQMAEEKKALVDLRELAIKQNDPALNKELERNWRAFMKQQVRVLNKIHDTSLMAGRV